MAFVADYTDEELQKALAAQGGAPSMSSGPSVGVGGPSGRAGGAPPAGAAPASTPGAGQGTGFVNLSRYFDANQGAAQNQAQALIDPLKTDPVQAGLAAGSQVPNAPAPVPVDPVMATDYMPTGEQVDVVNAEATAQNQRTQDAKDRQAQQDALKAREAAAARASAQAVSGSLQTANGYMTDQNTRNAAMTKDGRGPSGFDSYLTGAALPQAYGGLESYFAGDRGGPSRPAQTAGNLQPGYDALRGGLTPKPKKPKTVGGW